MKKFVKEIYWRCRGIICLIIRRRYLVVTGDHLLFIQDHMTIDDARHIAKYLNKLADDKSEKIIQEKAVQEVRKIIGEK